MADRKVIWCRNCGEFVSHNVIGVQRTSLFFWERLYACRVCNCQVSNSILERILGHPPEVLI